ncbi:UNVERIFIED_CONTAM: hypothetical protein FKN15_023448 [Acipenser sinensis]
MERATRASSVSSMAGSSAALGAPEPLLHDLSQDPLLNIPDAQASSSHSPSLQVRRVKRSKQVKDIMDLKAQMAQVLELLAKQAMAAPASVQAPLQPKLPSPSPRGVHGGLEKASQLAQEDTPSIVASGEGASFSSDMQVPWTPVAEPSQSVFRMQTMALRPQKFPAFPDFMEEVRSSWDRPASGPSVLKQAAPLTSLGGAEKLVLAGFCRWGGWLETQRARTFNARFCIDMGKDSNEMALHFNPRFHDDAAGTVIVCNSKRGGCWGSEQRDPNFPFEKGATIKLTVRVLGNCFEIELPNEHIVTFPNHLSLDKITYIRVKGDLKVTSFKFE